MTFFGKKLGRRRPAANNKQEDNRMSRTGLSYSSNHEIKSCVGSPTDACRNIPAITNTGTPRTILSTCTSCSSTRSIGSTITDTPSDSKNFSPNHGYVSKNQNNGNSIRLKNPLNFMRKGGSKSNNILNSEPANNNVKLPATTSSVESRRRSRSSTQAHAKPDENLRAEIIPHRLLYHQHVYAESSESIVFYGQSNRSTTTDESSRGSESARSISVAAGVGGDSTPIIIPASWAYEQLSKDRHTAQGTSKDCNNSNALKDITKWTSNTSDEKKMNNAPMTDEDAVAAADKEMEERANRAKELLSQRYKGLKSAQESKQMRKMQLERQMIGLPEEKKQNLREVLEHEELTIQKENRKKISTADFESLTVVGRGAFGEVRLVRRKGKPEDPSTGEIFALKSMKKEMMVVKNQVGHVRAERDALAKASDANRWLTALHYSFFDDTHLYMIMEFLPGGDLMSLLIKEDTFSESITRFFMAEAAQAISSVHALGYIHRDIKPDNMLLDARGHLKLTDLGLCKKVGEVSPGDDPEVVLEILKNKGANLTAGAPQAALLNSQQPPGAAAGSPGGAKHRNADDVMAMSIDDNAGVEVGLDGLRPQKPKYESAKVRREMAYSTVGTPDYIAPEVLAAQNGASGYSYTCAVDWWSLGVIMFECLVGYTPFYADDPVTTCRKILRWRQCLDMPAETKSQLSPECIDFLSCLLAGPEKRIGSSKNGHDFENGFKQVVQHPWFRDFDWEGLRTKDGPLLPSGSKEFPELLKYLRTCPKSDPRFKQLVQRVTQNFDTFEDFGTNLENEGKARVSRNALDQFYDYSYRRARKPSVPLPDNFS